MEEIIEKIKWDLLQEEGITKEDLEMVDLEIEFTPVIPVKGASPMEAIKVKGGMYRVPDYPLVGLNLSKEEITIMRYRFLINRSRHRGNLF